MDRELIAVLTVVDMTTPGRDPMTVVGRIIETIDVDEDTLEMRLVDPAGSDDSVVTITLSSKG
jgi:hypothetical protein